MKKQTKKASSLAIFFITIGVGAILGAVLGFSAGYMGENLNDIMGHAVMFIGKNIVVMQIVVLVAVSFVVLALQTSSKKLIANISDEDTPVLEKAEGRLSVVLGFTVANNIFAFFSMFVIVYFSSLIDFVDSNLLIGVAISISALLINVYYEVSNIKLIKKINPEKEGDPLKFNFEKEYLGSMDEAELQLAYASSYKSFQILKHAFIFMMAILILLQSVTEIGIAAPLCVAILWGIHSITYVVASSKRNK